MRTTLSVSCWVSLLTLAVVMLAFESEARGGVASPCCLRVRKKEIKEDIKKCYEQLEEWPCYRHAYWIKTSLNNIYCVHPKAPWLKKEINVKKDCGPLTKPVKREFQVLDEDDVE